MLYKKNYDIDILDYQRCCNSGIPRGSINYNLTQYIGLKNVIIYL